jgi:copper chaperone NosL
MRLRHWHSIQSPKSLCTCLLAALVLVMLACGKEIVPKPLDITADDTCLFCKKPIVEKRYAAEFVTKDGFVRKFDDIACMVQHANKVKKNNIAAFFATDYPSGTWINATDAVFLRSEGFKKQVAGGVLAYKDRSRAEGIAAQYKAELVKFDDILK